MRVLLLVLLLLTGCAARTAAPAPAPPAAAPPFPELEARFGAHLGVYALDTGSGKEVAYHADQRFAYASTIKALATGAVLRNGTALDKVLAYSSEDVVAHSPVTGGRTSVTLREAARAALQQSDNTAGNLLFGELGGPQGLNAALREVGDTTTHADRTEVALNEAVPGDVRDTSTPRAMATALRAFLLGDALPADSRAVLEGWMRGNTTGATLIRAGVPAGWTVADKTGAGNYGTRNDLAVAWPPSGAPVILAVMSTKDVQDASHEDGLIAQATSAAFAALGRG